MLETLQAKSYESDSLKDLRKTQLPILTNLELLLPTNWMSLVRHHLVHLVRDYIPMMGPVHEWSLYSMERFHSLFKKMARGKKNPVASFATHWAMISQGNYLPPDFVHSFEGANYSKNSPQFYVDRLWTSREVRVRGNKRSGSLSDRHFQMLIRVLNDENIENRVTFYDKMQYGPRGTLFKTRASQKHAFDDSGIKDWESDRKNEGLPQYGWIESIFTHAREDNQTETFAIVEWLDMSEEVDLVSKLPYGARNENSRLNLGWQVLENMFYLIF